MLVERKSPISGKTNTMDLNITEEEIRRYNSGELIQRAFPNLNATEREFIMTGITEEEWNQIYPNDED